MYADGTLTNYFWRLLPRSHSGSIHPVGWIKGDAVAVSQSQVLQALSVWEGCDSQLIYAHPTHLPSPGRTTQGGSTALTCTHLHSTALRWTQRAQVTQSCSFSPYDQIGLCQYSMVHTIQGSLLLAPGPQSIQEQPPGLLSCSSWWHQSPQAPEVHSSLQLLGTALSSHSVLLHTHLEQRAHPHIRQI